MDRFIRSVSDLHTLLYRRTGGRVAGTLMGGEILLLTTTGRRSGQKRTTPLLYIPDGERFVVVASKGGAQSHPAWWLNLSANPRAEIEVAGRKLPVHATEPPKPERERLWRAALRVYPTYQSYQDRTSRRIPVVILDPVIED